MKLTTGLALGMMMMLFLLSLHNVSSGPNSIDDQAIGTTRGPEPICPAPSKVNWIVELPGRITDLEMDEKGNAYFIGEDDILRCADHVGSVLWTFDLPGSGDFEIQLAKDRTFLYDSDDLICLDHEGTLLWEKAPDDGMFYDIVLGDDTVFVNENSELAVLYDMEGNEKWEWHLEEVIEEEGDEEYGWKRPYTPSNIQDIWIDNNGRPVVRSYEYIDDNYTSTVDVFDQDGGIVFHINDSYDDEKELRIDEGYLVIISYSNDSFTVQTLNNENALINMNVNGPIDADVPIDDVMVLPGGTMIIGNGYTSFEGNNGSWLYSLDMESGSVMGEFRSELMTGILYSELYIQGDDEIWVYEYDVDLNNIDLILFDRFLNERSRIINCSEDLIYGMYMAKKIGDSYYSLNDGRLLKIDMTEGLEYINLSERVKGPQHISIFRYFNDRIIICGYGLYSYDLNGSLEWKIDVPGKMTSDPIQNIDGNIIVETCYDEIKCVSRTGELLWTFDREGIPFEDLALFENGSIFLSDQTGGIHCLDSTGNLLWNYAYTTGDIAGVTIGSGGTILVLEEGGNISKLDWGGHVVKRVKVPYSYDERISVNTNGDVIIGAIGAGKNIICLDRDLNERWTITPENEYFSGPVAGPDGKIYYSDDEVHALNMDGIEVWSINERWGGLNPGYDGDLYLIGGSTILHILPNGSKDWEAESFVSGSSSTILTKENGALFCYGDSLAALSSNGSLLWKYIPPRWQYGVNNIDHTPIMDNSDDDTMYLPMAMGLISISLSSKDWLPPPVILDLRENMDDGIEWDLEISEEGSVLKGLRIFKGRSPEDMRYYRTLFWNYRSWSDRDEWRNNRTYYSVQAFNQFSSSITGPVMNDHTPYDRLPTWVRNVTIDVGKERITIHWDPPKDPGENGLTGYRVYRANGTRDRNFTLIAKLEPNVTSYTDNGLEPYKWYYYEIASENEFGWKRNTSSWGGNPYEDFDLRYISGLFLGPAIILVPVALISRARIKRWRTEGTWFSIQGPDRQEGSGHGIFKGPLIYRHWNMLDRASAYLMLGGYGLGLLMAVSAPIVMMGAISPSEMLGLVLRDPALIFLVLFDAVYLTSVIWVPLLFFPTTLVVHENGLDPGSNRFNRWTGRRPSFIEYRDISVLYPRFEATIQANPNEIKGDRFRSFIIVMKDGRRYEVLWNPYNYIDQDDRFGPFKEFLSKVPEGFRDLWSERPLPSDKEMRLIEKVRKEKDGLDNRKVPRYKIVLFILAGITSLIVILSLMPTLLILKDETDLGVLNTPLLIIGLGGFLLLIVTMVVISIIESRKKNIPSLIHQLDGHNIDGKQGTSEPSFQLPGVVFIDEGRPYDPKTIKELITLDFDERKIERAVIASRKYRRPWGTVAFITTITAIFGGFISYMVLFLVPWWIGTFGLLVSLVLGTISALLEWKFKALSIDSSRSVIERTFIKEVVTGQTIFPKDFKVPHMIAYERGRDPIREGDLKKIRWWGRFSQKAIQRFFFGTFIFMFLFTLITMMITIWFCEKELCLIISISLIVTISIGFFGLGFFVMIRSSTVMGWMDRYTLWERYTGIKVLPDDVQSIDERRKANGKKKDPIPNRSEGR